MTEKGQRAFCVRPKGEPFEINIAPIQMGESDLEAKQKEEDKATVKQTEDIREESDEWQEMNEKVKDINVRVARHFEDANDNNGWIPPMIRPPLQPTKEEWFRHQFTHTPYAPWCKHCNAGRAVRNSHKSAAKRARLALDTDKSVDGPVKISTDYMYMHD